jgi:CheY-like chemotaxis protein
MQATEKIRQQDGPNQRTPIIAVTANAMKGDRDKVLRKRISSVIKNVLLCKE